MSAKKEPEEKKNSYMIELTRPYLFEGVEYTSVDLSKLEDISTEALLRAERSWMLRDGASNQMETSYSFCLEVAATATGLPFEFFSRLPKRDGIRVKIAVQKDFFGVTE